MGKLNDQEWQSMHLELNEEFVWACSAKGWKLRRIVNGKPIFDAEVDEKELSELARECFRGAAPVVKEKKPEPKPAPKQVEEPEPEEKPKKKKRRGRPKGSKNKPKDKGNE